MTLPTDIAAIAARHDIAYSDRRHSIVKAFKNAHNDLATLLRAYRELAGELEAVSKSFDAAHAEVEQLTQERDEWRRLQHKAGRALESRIQECDRLRAEVQRLHREWDSACRSLAELHRLFNARGDELDRLRVCITKLQDGTATVDVPQAECDRLRASNAKLQRALRDIYKSDCPDSLALEDWQGLTLKLQRKAMAALADAQHPEQQPDIDAFLGEGRKPVRSLASVMVPSARDPEQQPENDPHMLCVCGHAVVEHTCANDDCGCLAFKRAATAPPEQQPDSDARDEVAK